MKHAIKVASCGTIYVLRFMKTGIGVQAILRFGLSYLRGCHRMHLCSMSLRWVRVP
jgi:hypothetical protein